jgi:hypothetical protein
VSVSTVFFDFGGVFTYSPFTKIDEFGIQRGARPGEFVEIIFGSYHVDGDHPWHRLERGEISLEGALSSWGAQRDTRSTCTSCLPSCPGTGACDRSWWTR